jgi:hypothetical protein
MRTGKACGPWRLQLSAPPQPTTVRRIRQEKSCFSGFILFTTDAQVTDAAVLVLFEDDQEIVITRAVVGRDGDNFPAIAKQVFEIVLAGAVGLNDERRLHYYFLTRHGAYKAPPLKALTYVTIVSEFNCPGAVGFPRKV